MNLREIIISITGVMRMAMVTMGSPMPAVPVCWGRGIICIWIPGIWIVVNVRVPIVPIGIIIKIARRTGVAARKSKTESLSSGNQDGGLGVRMLRRNNRQSAHPQYNQEKPFHKIFPSYFVCFQGIEHCAGHFLGAKPFPNDKIGRAASYGSPNPPHFSMGLILEN